MRYLKETALGSFADLGSRFECEIIPLSSPEELKAAQDGFQKRHPKADHYPYAFRYEGNSRSSDDGEPSGTGGRPLLSLLEQKELDCVLVMVARYFGGTKLGIPRLRRAFVEAANNALEGTPLYIRKELYVYPLEVSYSVYSVLEKNQERYQYSLHETVFDVNVLTKIYSFDKMNTPWEKMGLSPDLLPKPMIQQQLVEEASL